MVQDFLALFAGRDTLSPNPSSPTPTLTGSGSEAASSPKEFEVSDFGKDVSSLIQSDFWFEDGSVVLISGNVKFKVHRGILTRHSIIFEDVLSLPPPVNEETIDGCPIVELHDTPSDIWHLLRAMYDGLYFKQLAAADFTGIAAIHRLSTKYFVEHLRERCLSRLSIDWPVALSSWDSREMEATDSVGRYTPRARFAHPIFIINYARESGLSDLLPCAFYDLCRYGPSKIVAGVVKSYTDEDTPLKTTSSVASPKATNMSTHLSPADLKIALIGRERAQRVVATFIEEELTNREPAPDCHGRANTAVHNGVRMNFCRESFYYIMLNLLRAVSGLSSGRDCDPLYSLTQAVEMMGRSDFSDGTNLMSLKLCVPCRQEFTESVRVARERIWLQIPSWFGMKDFSGEPAEATLL